MDKFQNTKATLTKALKVLVATCVVATLTPTAALADTALGVKIEAPQQVNETVALTSQTSQATVPESGDTTTEEQAPESADATGQMPQNQITTQVDIKTTDDTTSETLLLDGLTYALNQETKTATLTGWYGSAPKGNLSLPSTVSDGKFVFTLQRIGGGPDFFA